MKKVLLTLTTILTLASCQDKFEQIDANFLYQQEQIDAIKRNVEENVANLQSQIDATNDKLTSDVNTLNEVIEANVIAQDEVNELLFSLVSDLEDADAEMLVYVNELNEIQTELLNAEADKIDALNDSQESIKNDINDLFNQLEIDFISKFNLLSSDNALLVAQLFHEIQFETLTGWEILIDNSITNTTTSTVDVPAVETGTASTSTTTDTVEIADPVESVESLIAQFLDNGAVGDTVVIQGTTITRTTNGLYTFVKEGTIQNFASTAINNRNEMITKIANYING